MPIPHRLWATGSGCLALGAERPAAKRCRMLLLEELPAFDAAGARIWAERAAAELRAAGAVQPERRSRTGRDAVSSLTAQELQIARMVATGATSREVGAQLFLSPRTIEAHLRSIFRKLGITSRRQLRDLPTL